MVQSPPQPATTTGSGWSPPVVRTHDERGIKRTVYVDPDTNAVVDRLARDLKWKASPVADALLSLALLPFRLPDGSVDMRAVALRLFEWDLARRSTQEG